jgi:RimJ/RimL family protein N-acetyltransferase
VTASIRFRQRPVQREDEAALLALLDRCSIETLRRRFLGHSESAGIGYIREVVTETDHISYLMQRSHRRGNQIVAIASVFLNSDSTGEIVALVEDRWQGCGIGTRLIKQLCHDAALLGTHELQLSMLTGNGAMRAVFRKACPAVRYTQPEAGIVDGVLPLSTARVPNQRPPQPFVDPVTHVA